MGLVFFFFFFIHSIILCLLVGAFNPFTFKVIIDIYVPIAIFLIVWGWFCRSSSVVKQTYIVKKYICCKAGLVILNSLNFCLSEKLFISPSVLNEIFAGYSNLNCRFFLFSTLNISCHSLLVYRFSAERLAVKHMGFPFMILTASPLLILMFCFVFNLC